MRLLFAGTPEFAARHLRAVLDAGFAVSAVLTQPDRPGKRGAALVAPPVKRLALDAGLEVLQPAKLEVADLADLQVDAMVVVAYGQLLGRAVLAHPRLGCVNVHASLLPRWRGAAPVQRALLAGDDTTGCTIMQMDAGLDTGGILAQRMLDIGPEETAGSLEARLAEVGAEALIDVLGRLDGLRAVPQAEAGACYARKIDKEEARLAWGQTAELVGRQVRAFNPAPGAFCYLGEMRVKVWEGRPVAEVAGAAPGTILALDKRALTVACGEGCLAVTSVTLPKGQGKPLSARDLVNGWGELLKPGEVLA